MMESQKLKMPLEAGIVEYHKLRDKLKSDYASLLSRGKFSISLFQDGSAPDERTDFSVFRNGPE